MHSFMLWCVLAELSECPDGSGRAATVAGQVGGERLLKHVQWGRQSTCFSGQKLFLRNRGLWPEENHFEAGHHEHENSTSHDCT